VVRLVGYSRRVHEVGAPYLASLAGHGAVMVPGGGVTAHHTRIRTFLGAHVARYVRRAYSAHSLIDRPR